MALRLAFALPLFLAQIDPLLDHAAGKQGNVTRRVGTSQKAHFLVGICGGADPHGAIIEVISRTTEGLIGVTKAVVKQAGLAGGLHTGMVFCLEEGSLLADKVG